MYNKYQCNVYQCIPNTNVMYTNVYLLIYTNVMYTNVYLYIPM